MKELLLALSEAKKEIGAVSKESTNPFFKSKYFDINQLLEHVEPVLQKHGLFILQPIINGQVVTEVFHVETGQSLNSSIELPIFTDPQKLGGAITYYRRYTLQSLLALQSQDDDANAASKASKSNKIKMVDKSEHWNNAVSKLQAGSITMAKIKSVYELTEKQEDQLLTYLP